MLFVLVWYFLKPRCIDFREELADPLDQCPLRAPTAAGRRRVFVVLDVDAIDEHLDALLRSKCLDLGCK